MKRLTLLIPLLLFVLFAKSQNINVSGACISGTVTLEQITDVNGKPAYQATGATVDGASNVTVSVYWIDAPDNVWVVDFDGQPYFSNSDNTATPPFSASTTAGWQPVSGTDCSGSTPVDVANASSATPVTLLNFSATIIDKSVELTWKTATEMNNKGFSIQRSKDANLWQDIGFVNGAGNSNTEKDYTFTDKQPPLDKWYYRLKQEDADGKIAYSSIIAVDLSAINYAVFNNPGKGVYTLQIPQGQSVMVNVYNLNGAKVFTNQVNTISSTINLTAQPSGVYILHIVNGLHDFSTKLIKL